MAAHAAKGQEDVPAAAGAAVGSRSLDHLTPGARRSHAVPGHRDQSGRGLREILDEADTPKYFGMVAAAASHPTASVEYALRAGHSLTEAQVRQVMDCYLAQRLRRLVLPQNGPVLCAVPNELPKRH